MGMTGKPQGRRGDGGPQRRSATSIAVCPYVSVGKHDQNAGFAACVTLIIIDALMGFADLKVISAGSMLSFGRYDRSLRSIGRALGVRYILTGEIAQYGPTLIFSHMICDTETGEIWPLLDTPVGVGNLHDFERWVVPRIIGEVLPDLQDIEIEKALAKPTRSLRAQDCFLRGWVALHRLTRAGLDEAEHYFVRAQKLDPSYATAFAWHARVHSIRIGQDWTIDPKATGREAERLAIKAITLDPYNAVALAIAGHMRSYIFRDYRGALALFERAIAAGPNEPTAWLLSSVTLAYVGRASEGRRNAEYALSLSPRDRLSFLFHAFAATCMYAEGDYAAAERSARLSYSENPHYSATHRLLATSLAAQGRLREAREFGAGLLRMQPAFAQDSERLILFADPIVRARCFRHLRMAGVVPPLPIVSQATAD